MIIKFSGKKNCEQSRTTALLLLLTLYPFLNFLEYDAEETETKKFSR